MKNEGIEEHFYIPLEFYDEWNHFIYEHNFNYLRMRGTGVPLGMPLGSQHLLAKACFMAKRLGLKSRNLLETYYDRDK